MFGLIIFDGVTDVLASGFPYKNLCPQLLISYDFLETFAVFLAVIWRYACDFSILYSIIFDKVGRKILRNWLSSVPDLIQDIS